MSAVAFVLSRSAVARRKDQRGGRWIEYTITGTME